MGKYLTAPVSLKAGSRHNAAVRASRSRVRSPKAFLRGARRCSVSLSLLSSQLCTLSEQANAQSIKSSKTLAIGREAIRPTTRSLGPSLAEIYDDSDSEYEYNPEDFSESDFDPSEFSDGDFQSNWE